MEGLPASVRCHRAGKVFFQPVYAHRAVSLFTSLTKKQPLLTDMSDGVAALTDDMICSCVPMVGRYSA